MHCLRGHHHFANCLGFACLCHHRRNFIFDETSELSDYLCVLSKHKTNQRPRRLFPIRGRPLPLASLDQDYFDECRICVRPVFVRGITRSWKGDRYPWWIGAISLHLITNTRHFFVNICERSINNQLNFDAYRLNGDFLF